MRQCMPRISPSSPRLSVKPVFVLLLMTLAFAYASWPCDVSSASPPSGGLASSMSDAVPVQPRAPSITEASGTATRGSMPRTTGSNMFPQVAQAEALQSSEEDVREQAEEARRARDIFLREERILIRQGELQLEFSTFYSIDTRDQLIPILGENSLLVQSKNRAVSTNLLGRYALVDDLELVLAIPFLVYREQTNELQVRGMEQTLDATGVGNISGSLRFQIWHETASIPDVVLELNGKFPTSDDLRLSGDEQLLGTGAWEVGGEITLVKTLDPVVFFGRVGYTHRFGDLGNVVSASLGMGFSLNDRASYNMQVIGAFVDRPDVVDETTLGGPSTLEIVSFQFAVTVLVSRRLFVEPVVNFGLSDDAVDVVVGVNIPFQLQRHDALTGAVER
jgi:hypothetical protein